MKKKLALFCSIFYGASIFSQTQIYKSDFSDFNITDQKMYTSLVMAGNTIVFNASDFKLYGIDKTTFKTNWEIYAGTKSNVPAYIYKDSFFYDKRGYNEKSLLQYDVKTGTKIQELSMEGISSAPHFVGNKMYFTGLEVGGGGVLVAYDLDQNSIIWKAFIGHGSDYQPVYQKDKIVVSVDKNYWTHLSYDGKPVEMRSEKSFEIGDMPYYVLNYELLTHDGKEISQEFLRENDLTSFYDFKTTEKHTIVISNSNLVVWGNNKKLKILQDLLRYTSSYNENAPFKIVKADDETVWFLYQNHLIHYDFKHKKLLRNANLEKWQPRQVLMDNRTIWLISKNDGQIYALDFERNEDRTAEKKFKNNN